MKPVEAETGERIARRQFYTHNPLLLRALSDLDKAVRESGLDPRLIELLKVRASQLNACGFCLFHHCADARKGGEEQYRLDSLIAWRELPHYSAAERAALNWCERLTLLAQGGVDDAAFQQLAQHFTEEEIVQLTSLVIVINALNRMAVSMRFLPDPAQLKRG